MLTSIGPSQWLDLAINAPLPAVVALVTHRLAHPGIKAAVLLFLSALSGFLITWQDAVVNSLPFDWSAAGFTALSGFAVAALTHFALLGPMSVTGAGGVIATTFPGGLGAPHGRHELSR
jgi:hypothetical protein